MGRIGIIANPSSGKDIRRLVGQALVIGRREKINIVKRVLIGAYSIGVRDFWIMPDVSHIGEACIHGLKKLYPDLIKYIKIMDMDVEDSDQDTIAAAEMLHKGGADCIVSLGGDGTVRAISKGAGNTPIMPISTGTNNVLPNFIEGTIAGMAAGYFSLLPQEQKRQFTSQQKKINIRVDGNTLDYALVDIVVLKGQHIGSKAVWDPGQILQIAVTRASPMNIGFSSIIGQAKILTKDAPIGACVRITGGNSSSAVKAPIGPGMVSDFCIDDFTEMLPGESTALISERPVMLALDGERQMALTENETAEINLDLDGPYFINIQRVLEHKIKKNKM